MSRRRPRSSRFSPGITRYFGVATLGARFASLLVQTPRLPLWGKAALACLFGLSTSGCLVTNQIDLPPRPQTPPVLLSTTPMVGGIVVFDTSLQELKLSMRIRDEDTTEILKGRWRLVTGNNPPRTPTSKDDLDYKCPEPEIPGSPGIVERPQQLEIIIDRQRLQRGNCYRIDVRVSSSFQSCEKRPDLFDITTNEDNDEDVGRAAFWVWPLDRGTFDSDPTAAMLAKSCPRADYQSPTATAASSVEK